MNAQVLRDRWAGLSRFQKLEYGGGAVIALLFGLAFAASVSPIFGVLLIAVAIGLPIYLLLGSRIGSIGAFGPKTRSWLARFALALGGLILIGLMFASASGHMFALMAVLIVGIVGRAIIIQRRNHRRRMLPNRRAAIKTAHSSEEADSEELFRDFWHLVAAGNAGDSDDGEPNRKARSEGAGIITGTLLFSRPDEHGAVLAESFIEGHEDTDPPDSLEHSVQSIFAGELSVFPVEEAAYPANADVERWQANQGANPDHDYDPDEIEDIAPPPR